MNRFSSIRLFLGSFILVILIRDAVASRRCNGCDSTLYAFERCKGGLLCAPKRACYLINRRKRTLNETFFPLRNCGANGKGKEDECACLHVGVESGVCDSSSDCTMERKCFSNLKDCDEPNLCVHLTGSGNKLDDQLCNHVKKVDKKADCRCATPDMLIFRKCKSDINCERDFEICTTIKGLDGKRCVGKTELSPLLLRFLPDYVPPSPSPLDLGGTPEPEPCIAVDALEQIDAQNLVYKEHLRSSVLCDENKSCASAGHIVRFSYQFMSMQTYCQLHARSGCVKTVRMVNSPRMAKGLRITSRTDGLQYTALSARHQTRFEERLLSFALYLGI